MIARKEDISKTPIFWVMVVFLAAIFCLGGSSRGDVGSLVILRPLAALVCGGALITLSKDHFVKNKMLLYFAIACAAIPILHLISLPPSIWHALPGRELLVDVDRNLGLKNMWRPISMVPSTSWNALYSLLVPLAVLLLGIQLTREERFALLPVVLILAMVSAAFGLAQVVAPANSLLFLYGNGEDGSAVGFFANRNHQAVLLAGLFPILAVFASTNIRTIEQARMKMWIAIAVAAILIPLLLVTGSRAGLIAGVIGLFSALLLYRRPKVDMPARRKGGRSYTRYIVAIFALFLVGALTFIMARAQAFDRLLSSDTTDELRGPIWQASYDAAIKYFPVGSGSGTFVEALQITEPDHLLVRTYHNHAHNDWIEVIMTMGAPGALLLIIAVAAIVVASWKRWRSDISNSQAPRREILFGRMVSLIALQLALASIADYPLRTPIMMALSVILALWLWLPAKKSVENTM